MTVALFHKFLGGPAKNMWRALMVTTMVFISHATKGDDAFKPVRAVCEELTVRAMRA